jgi:transcriptional regulator of arginine metabolism
MSSASPRTATARRARIAALIATHDIVSQEELGALLTAEGISVTQATLSRDLLALGATKVADARGRMHYTVDVAADTSIPTVGAESTLARVANELLLRAEAAGNIAVIHTPPGAAQFFAGHLDRTQAFDPVGSVAGDDTIIIVMRTPEEAAGLCTTLLRMADDRRAS